MPQITHLAPLQWLFTMEIIKSLYISPRHTIMRQPHMNDFVRLTADIPELALNRGEVGVVRGRQISARGAGSEVVYEVEFHQIGHDYQTRTLLWPHQLEVQEGALSDIDRPA
jgi:hypothetical protein